MLRLLKSDFPGFRVLELRYDDEPSPALFYSRLTRYYFIIESEDVEGFKLSGSYYLYRQGGTQGWQARGSIFDRRELTTKQVTGLEQLWVKTFPEVAVSVGDDAFTTVMSPDEIRSESGTVAERYEGIPVEEVYRLEGQWPEARSNTAEYFRLNPQNDEWQHLPGYIEEPGPPPA